MLKPTLRETIDAYDPAAKLGRATTPPSAWYTSPDVYRLEQRAVFGRTWLVAARTDPLRAAGQYVTADLAGEPVVVVRGRDGVLRGFHNVCSHHAAEVATQPEGCAKVLRCPYHGWTYSLEGELRGTPDFDGVEGFDRAAAGLTPLRVESWEHFVFVCLDADAPPLKTFLGGLVERVAPLGLGSLKFVERKTYELKCNWKVFVDNYLDGGYHLPHIHKGLGSVLSYKDYTIEIEDRFCLQSSPITTDHADRQTATVRGGAAAYYFWQYPNLMINWYEGLMDINIAVPLAVDRTRVIFDFYFADTDAADGDRNRQSIAVAERVQEEDSAICESVQRGLASRAYDVGRLSVRREAGEHLFHRLLFEDLHGELLRESAGVS